MKLHCHQPTLAAAFQIVSGVVPTRTPKDILKNIRLTARDGRVTLTGTDQEVAMRYDVAGVEATGDVDTLLPTNRVLSILRELQDQSVEFDIDVDSVTLTSGHSRFRLSVHDASEYPPVPDFDDDAYLTVSGSDARQMVRRTTFATDVESTRYALGGVLFELTDGTLTLAATDSRRLALVRTPATVSGEIPLNGAKPIVPTKALTLLERSVESGDAEVRLAVHANDVVFRTGSSTVYSRLVEGRFPQYRDVIPREVKHTIDIVVGPFYAAIRQAQIVTNEESRGVDFVFGNGMLTLRSQAADVGQSTVEMPISYDSEELTIMFDPSFIAEYLRILEPETQVQLKLIDSESAAVLQADDNYTYVIMPLSRDG